jgi:malonyl-CoA/methylmalonyl-CoA synthetase
MNANERAWARHGFDGVAISLIAEESLVSAWTRRWSAQPTDLVLHDSSTNTWWTAADIDAASLGAASRLVAGGHRVGDRLAMSCMPSVALVVAHIAALRCGLVVVPINTGFTEQEKHNIVAESGAGLFIDDAKLPFDHLPLATDADRREVLDRQHRLRADDPALLLFTSGTTGRPKGALLSHGNILSSARALVVAWGWLPSDRLVLALPLFHMHGLGVGVHGTLLAGASAIVLPSFSPDVVFDAIAAHRATMMFGVPTMWVRLLASPRVGELATLRLCVSGSAPLAPDVWDGLADLGHQPIIERYGMTETVMLTSNPLVGDRRAGTVGVALPGVEVRLATPGPDGVGEIEVRGPNVFRGYLDRPDANADAFSPDGWFRTGDLGRFDDNGYLLIVGRSKDLIITGGYNVYPRDVEDVIRQLPQIADCAVVGEPNAEWGETVTACVIATQGLLIDSQAVLSFASEHLAAYQRPRRIVILDEFPRNALGKVVKIELQRQIGTASRHGDASDEQKRE